MPTSLLVEMLGVAMPRQVVHVDRRDSALLRRAESQISSLQSDLWMTAGGPMRVILVVTDDRAYYVAEAMQRFERELRRSVVHFGRGETLSLEPTRYRLA